MRSLITISLILCTSLSGQAYSEQVSRWWAGATAGQRECALWYAQYYGVDVAAKCILESSGGADMDHGDEGSYRELGLNKVTARRFRKKMTKQALLDSLQYGSRHWHGRLCREIVDDNLYHMRHKQRPDLCAAFVYQGWKIWMDRKKRIGSDEWHERLARAEMDLAWQEFLKQRKQWRE